MCTPSDLPFTRTVARKFSIGVFAFLWGAWGLCRGLDTLKIGKTQLIYSVSCLNLGAWSIFGGFKPPKSPHGDGTAFYFFLLLSVSFLSQSYDVRMPSFLSHYWIPVLWWVGV